MAIPIYQDHGPLQISTHLDLGKLVDKSVIITGGASGLGKAYAEAFAKAGSFVTIGDFNEDAGKQTVAELGGRNVQFIQCDVRNWDQQVALFDAAIANSPNKSCDIVIANAGVIGKDDMYTFEDANGPPVKPNLRTVEINLIGLLYTTKLSMHYFRRQPCDSSHDRCLILKASIAAYADQPGAPQYNVSKWGTRGLMRNLRRTAWKENIRVNLVAPWYMRTSILPVEVQHFLESKGVGFGLVEDACKAMLKIASDVSINGRAIGVVPRQATSEGYMDLDHDDYKDGDVFKEWQQIVLDTAHKIIE